MFSIAIFREAASFILRALVVSELMEIPAHIYLFVQEALARSPLPLTVTILIAVLGGVYLLFSREKIPTVRVPAPEASQPGWEGGRVLEKPSIRDPNNPDVIVCYDPATGRHLGNVKAHTAEDVAEAVKKARAAQKAWEKTTFRERRRVLKTILKFVLDNQEDIQRVASRDTGKTMVDAAFGEVLTTCEKLRWTIENGERTLRDDYRSVNLLMLHKTAKVIYQPWGVTAALVSWNYPFHNTIGPVISSLFAGNATIIKCSEHAAWSTSYYLQIIRSCLEACGHSPDLVHFLVGFVECGQAVVTSGVDHITFIGSPEVGRKVQESAASKLCPCTLELGGKDCAILCEDANLEHAFPLIMRGNFQNCGQNCVGLERIIAHTKLYDTFVSKAKELIDQLKMGSPLDEENVDCGAMTMAGQSDRLVALIDDAVQRGARLLAGGKPYVNPKYPSGQYFAPTLLVDVTPDMPIAHNELFAPVMVVMRAASDEEALEMANRCPYGLGSSVFTRNVRKGDEMARKLRVGMCNINDFACNYLVQSLPFGGVGISGYGRFAGPEGLRAMCTQKSMTVDTFPSLISTPLPPLWKYPMRRVRDSIPFGVGIVRAVYCDSIRDKVDGVAKILGALIGRK
ncbi:uncharacterized protein VTP21DRAFT_6034 [Calcarisporiella thermophila]|uniref:uncharacterized protein n=1 Tax=Calcarisporiella thermophila TaxID=911321 RepID=UPI003742CC2E